MKLSAGQCCCTQTEKNRSCSRFRPRVRGPSHCGFELTSPFPRARRYILKSLMPKQKSIVTCQGEQSQAAERFAASKRGWIVRAAGLGWKNSLPLPRCLLPLRASSSVWRRVQGRGLVKGSCMRTFDEMHVSRSRRSFFWPPCYRVPQK